MGSECIIRFQICCACACHGLHVRFLSSPPPYRPNLDYFMEELVMADPSEGVQDLLATAADSDVRGFSDPEGLVHGPESVMMHNGSMSHYTLGCVGIVCLIDAGID